MHIPSECTYCFYYNKELLKCLRVGEGSNNKGRIGVCWLEKGEAEY